MNNYSAVANDILDKAIVVYDNQFVINHIFLGQNCVKNALPIIKDANALEMPDFILEGLENLLNNKPHRLKFNPGKVTKFQKAVYKEMLKIPYGETISYSELAENIGCKGGSRAVGNACNKNPIPLIIPCHRVTAKDNIGGYGPGIEYKKRLLLHERMNSK